MIDALATLARKRDRLLQMRHRIELEAEEKISDIDRRLEAISMTVETLENALADYRCPCCKGQGYVRRCDAAGQADTEICSECNGTGIRMRIEEAEDDVE